jgi:Trypsin
MAHRLTTGARAAIRARAHVCVAVLLITLLSATGGVALGVVRGNVVSIKAVPWTVVVWAPFYVGEASHAECTGVIIDPVHILTAGHCVMTGNSANLLPPSSFRIEAGVSNPKHPRVSDAPQFREVSAVRSMPGYIAENKITQRNWITAAGYDLAVLTLSQPLDMSGDDVRAAYLPSAHKRAPSLHTTMVLAGFGNAKQKGLYADGTLSEVPTLLGSRGCSSRVLCVLGTAGLCWGDMGAGLIEPGPHPTVVGVLAQDPLVCDPEYDRYVSLIAPATRRFIKTAT